ncbi:unnamed protein product, partial [Amoebophrya sp. A25]|eukprot:GSA25T00000838001.1
MPGADGSDSDHEPSSRAEAQPRGSSTAEIVHVDNRTSNNVGARAEGRGDHVVRSNQTTTSATDFNAADEANALLDPLRRVLWPYLSVSHTASPRPRYYAQVRDSRGSQESRQARSTPRTRTRDNS